ncbi:MAG: helix-hairpin-helix domain-containing protein [Halobacteriaceae archaeon]
MGLLDAIKSALGLESSGRQRPRGASETTAKTMGDSGHTAATATDDSAETGAATAESATEGGTSVDVTGPGDETAGSGAQAPEGSGDEPSEGPGDETDVAGETAHPGAGVDLREVTGIGPAYADRLQDAGVDDVAALAERDPGPLAEEIDVPEGQVSDWVDQARDWQA